MTRGEDGFTLGMGLMNNFYFIVFKGMYRGVYLINLDCI